MKCASCPVESGPCLGAAHPRLCALAATRADYRAALAARASGSGSGESEASALAIVAACPFAKLCGCARPASSAGPADGGRAGGPSGSAGFVSRGNARNSAGVGGRTSAAGSA